MSVGEPTAYVMRGLPGSGKSTVAQQLASLTTRFNPQRRAVIASADHYFTRNGVYKFDRADLAAAHALCEQEFQQGVDIAAERVILDNTNVRHADYAKYAAYAREHGYAVVIVTMTLADVATCFRRCVHKVPLVDIKRMARRFQW